MHFLARRFAASLLLGCVVVAQAAPPAAAAAVHGRLETHAGLRVLRVWGSPAERGYAHGRLVGKDVSTVLIAEFTARFARQPQLLQQARSAIGRLIVYPDDVTAEIEALFAGLCDSGADRRMPDLGREFDLTDLLVANALDVFGLMGCSSFTLYGDQVEGGGVLTGRNFDWPLTGPHMLDGTLLIVQHPTEGAAVASVGWPGYVGTVTGVSSEGYVAYLHVGSANVTWTPEPESWPSAVAARATLLQARAADGAAAVELARSLLDYTSPPAGFLTHLVLPRVPADAPPFAVFETDAERCVLGERTAAAAVVTNHFHTRTDGRKASRDSLDRERRVRGGIDRCLAEGDLHVSTAEAWDLLRDVDRGGGHAFGTLHSLLFRHEPWCFELRVATLDGRKVVAAPDSERRLVLTREQVFGDGAVPK
ncbi:MAG: hypothetical protein JNL08_19375 [Planctomycetes bacterium]|nr:hypothetical protein [Planctomycetota bacterium]